MRQDAGRRVLQWEGGAGLEKEKDAKTAREESLLCGRS